MKVLGWREGSGISKGTRGGIRTRVAVSAVALYVDELDTTVHELRNQNALDPLIYKRSLCYTNIL